MTGGMNNVQNMNHNLRLKSNRDLPHTLGYQNANKTGTSQVGAISKAQIKSKRGPLGDKK